MLTFRRANTRVENVLYCKALMKVHTISADDQVRLNSVPILYNQNWPRGVILNCFRWAIKSKLNTPFLCFLKPKALICRS
jgi:hypothetical protein